MGFTIFFAAAAAALIAVSAATPLQIQPQGQLISPRQPPFGQAMSPEQQQPDRFSSWSQPLLYNQGGQAIAGDGAGGYQGATGEPATGIKINNINKIAVEPLLLLETAPTGTAAQSANAEAALQPAAEPDTEPAAQPTEMGAAAQATDTEAAPADEKAGAA